MFDTDFLENLASRIKANEQGEGRSKISLSEFLDIALAIVPMSTSTLQEVKDF